MHSIILISRAFKWSLSGKRGFASINLDSFGNPLSVLRFAANAIQTPELKGNEIQVKVSGALVSSEDIAHIRGEAQSRLLTELAGTSAVGTVVKVGSESRLKPNDQVLVFNDGSWGDSIVTSSDNVIAVSSLEPQIAAVLPIYLSALAILSNFPSLQAGESILQAGVSNNIGAAIAQIGRAKGFNVVSPSESEALDGAYGRKTRGQFKFVVTSNGGKIGSFAIRSLAAGGKAIVYRGKYQPLGELSTIDIPMSAAIFAGASISGFNFTSWRKANPNGLKLASEQVLQLISLKAITPVVPKVFPLKQYQKAIAEVASDDTPAVLTFN